MKTAIIVLLLIVIINVLIFMYCAITLLLDFDKTVRELEADVRHIKKALNDEDIKHIKKALSDDGK